MNFDVCSIPINCVEERFKKEKDFFGGWGHSRPRGKAISMR